MNKLIFILIALVLVGLSAFRIETNTETTVKKKWKKGHHHNKKGKWVKNRPKPKLQLSSEFDYDACDACFGEGDDERRLQLSDDICAQIEEECEEGPDE